MNCRIKPKATTPKPKVGYLGTKPKTKMSKEKKFDKFYKRMKKELNKGMNKDELIEDILDIINSENSGLSHQQRLNEIEKIINQNDANY